MIEASPAARRVAASVVALAVLVVVAVAAILTWSQLSAKVLAAAGAIDVSELTAPGQLEVRGDTAGGVIAPPATTCGTATFAYDIQPFARVDVQEFDAGPTSSSGVTKQSASPAVEGQSTPTTSLTRDRATNTASGASRTQLFRSVEPGELADLVGSGQFRTIAGQEGKYFFPTQQQAAAFDDIISGQAAVTSGKINSSLLSGVEQITISGEGAAWFIPEGLLPYIDDIVIHGAP